MADNLITRLLAEAAARAEKEREQHGIADGSESLDTKLSPPVDITTEELDSVQVSSSGKPSHKKYRYTIKFLQSLEKSPLCDDISHLVLPRKEFYRLNASRQRRDRYHNGPNNRRNNNNGSNNNNNSNGNNNNTNRNGPNRRERRSNGYGNKESNGNRRNGNGRYHEEYDPVVDGAMEMEDELLHADKAKGVDNTEEGHSMEDFERWRLKMRMETFRRKGEAVPEEDMKEYQMLQQHEEQKGGQNQQQATIDDEFASIPLNLTPKAEESHDDASVDAAAVPKASKFSMFFGQDDQKVDDSKKSDHSGAVSADPMGSSKLLSVLKSASEAASTATKASNLSPKKDSAFLGTILTDSKSQPKDKPRVGNRPAGSGTPTNPPQPFPYMPGPPPMGGFGRPPMNMPPYQQRMPFQPPQFQPPMPNGMPMPPFNGMVPNGMPGIPNGMANGMPPFMMAPPAPNQQNPQQPNQHPTQPSQQPIQHPIQQAQQPTQRPSQPVHQQVHVSQQKQQQNIRMLYQSQYGKQ